MVEAWRSVFASSQIDIPVKTPYGKIIIVEVKDSDICEQNTMQEKLRTRKAISPYQERLIAVRKQQLIMIATIPYKEAIPDGQADSLLSSA
ncbi:hypothetical protein Tco_0551424 [Tanacetum coccineum]